MIAAQCATGNLRCRSPQGSYLSRKSSPGLSRREGADGAAATVRRPRVVANPCGLLPSRLAERGDGAVGEALMLARIASGQITDTGCVSGRVRCPRGP